MKKYLLIAVFLFVMIPAAYATPPRDLKLEYDPVKQELTISMKHPTVELREHYIRTVNVSVNHQEPKVYRFAFQRLAAEVKTTVPIVLKSADLVYVKASCSQGGSAEADLVIAPDQAKSEK